MHRSRTSATRLRRRGSMCIRHCVDARSAAVDAFRAGAATAGTPRLRLRDRPRRNSLAPPKSYQAARRAVRRSRSRIRPSRYSASSLPMSSSARTAPRLQKLVVSQGFFWEGETGDKASKRKSSFENFATAIGLNDKSGIGLGHHRRGRGRTDA